MKIIEVVADAGHRDTLAGIAEQHDAVDFWVGAQDEDGRQSVRMLVKPEKRQGVLDALQGFLGGSDNARINVLPIEVTLPRVAEEPAEVQQKKAVLTTREELFHQIEKGSRLDGNHMLMVFLSTVVAAIGLVENNVAVVVGAMVIAPLLGPNISLAFATSLGDTRLIWESLKTNLAGLGFALVLSILIGIVWHVEPEGKEILSRTDVGIESALLALASGAAAVLSLTTGVSSALVGVMVAVALLPPTATLGMLVGSGHFNLAIGAALLLAVNVVCVNLSAKLVFLYRGVRPRTWLEQRQAKQSFTTYALVWVVLLCILFGAIYLRSRLV